MRIVVFAGAACILAALTAACAEPPVTPIPDAIRQSVNTVSADVSGMKDSDTSKLGARGSEEGSKLGAQQGFATVQRNTGGGSLLGLFVLGPIGAAVGSAKGSSEAQSVEIADVTRSNLRLAIQETDFTEVLRQRLAASRAAGPVQISAVTAGAASAPAVTTAGVPVGHVIALEYRLNVYGEHLVNPEIGVHVRVNAQVQSSDRKQLIHRATWVYCGERYHWVQMGADNAAAFRAAIDKAATVLAEAIPYDLYVSRQPRRLNVKDVCMDFSDLPSRTGQVPVILPPNLSAAPPQAPTPFATPTPSAAPTPVAAPIQVASVAPSAPSPNAVDGTWLIEMQISSTFCLAQSASVTFANRIAEGPWGKLHVTSDGELGGWLKLKPLNSASVDYLVNLSGRLENASITGTITGRCPGSFVMRKQ